MNSETRPVAYVNSDELDSMLGDRTATIAGVQDGWRRKPLYETAPRCAFETLDCRTCLNYRSKFWPGQCIATLRCVAGSSYRAGQMVQIWEEAPPTVAPF